MQLASTSTMPPRSAPTRWLVSRGRFRACQALISHPDNGDYGNARRGMRLSFSHFGLCARSFCADVPPCSRFDIILHMKQIEYIERATGERSVESVMGDGALRFAYETLLGRTLWPVLFGSKAVSALLGRYYDSPLSRKAISSLASIPGCQSAEAEMAPEEYPSFNAFFTRRLKAGARPVGEGFVSPADGRLMLYLGADADRPFPLKGASRSLRTVFAPC